MCFDSKIVPHTNSNVVLLFHTQAETGSHSNSFAQLVRGSPQSFQLARFQKILGQELVALLAREPEGDQGN